jgi:hypothetical protein
MKLPKVHKRSFLAGLTAGGAAVAGGFAIVEANRDKWEGFTFRPAGLEDRYFNAMTAFEPDNRRMWLHYNLVPATKPQVRWRGRSISSRTDMPQGLYVVENDVGVRAPLAITADPGRPAASTAVLIPDYTFYAYNRVGGGSLYTKQDWVEIRRPRVNSWPSGFGYAPLDLLAEAGIDYDLIQQSDLDVPELGYDLMAYEKIVLYGHDEYWTANIRSTIERAVAAGATLVNLSGNTCWWRLTRDEQLINRNVAGHWYKDTEFGPEEQLLGVSWRFAGYPVARKIKPENAKGIREGLLSLGFPNEYMGDDFETMTGSIRITDPSATILSGTGLERGDWLVGDWPVLDIEMDGLPMDRDGGIDLEKTKGFEPDELEIGAEGWGYSSSGRVEKGATRFAFMVKSRFRKGGMVYSLPSISWVRAAQQTGGALRQITLNALKA